MNRIILAVMLCLPIVVFAAASTFAQSLQYSPNPGEDYRYETKVELRLGTESIVLEGTTNYRVHSVEGNEVAMTCVGGLQEKVVRANAGQNRFGPNGRPGIGPNPPVESTFTSPFQQPAFRGKTVTTSEVTIAKNGELVAMVGESDLPYLLGHLSMLPFEPLPPGGEKRWAVEGKLGVQTIKQTNRFGAFNGFEDRNDRNLRAATTTLSYEVIREDDRLATVRKDYRLSLPVESEEAVLELSGTGEWAFDKVRKMPASMSFKYQMKIEVGGAVISAPMTLNYRLLSAEELAERKQIAEREKQEAARFEQQRKMAAERPLEPAEKAKILAGFNSQRAYDQMVALQALGNKTPATPDPEIATKIRYLMENGADVAVKQRARSVLENWDPEFKKLNKLITSYENSRFIESTGRTVDDSTVLYPGQIVQVKEYNRWRPAEVTELLGSGRVELKIRGPSSKREVFPRSEIQLAPEELPQPGPPRGYRAPQMNGGPRTESTAIQSSTAGNPPNESKLPNGAITPPRVWSSASGKHTVVASLMMISGNELVLKREDGKLITVAIADMSDVDRAFIEGIQIQRDGSKNPFE